jgi:hypothetical protein
MIQCCEEGKMEEAVLDDAGSLSYRVHVFLFFPSICFIH